MGGGRGNGRDFDIQDFADENGLDFDFDKFRPSGDDSNFTPPDMPSGDNSGSGGFTPPGAGNIPDMSNVPGMDGKPGMGALCPAGHKRLLHLCGVRAGRKHTQTILPAACGEHTGTA